MCDTAHSEKKDLIGEVEKAKATGGFTPDHERLGLSMSPGYVIRSFCTGCGNYLELSERAVQQLEGSAPSDTATVHVATILQGRHYVATASCSLCDGTDETVTIHQLAQQ